MVCEVLIHCCLFFAWIKFATRKLIYQYFCFRLFLQCESAATPRPPGARRARARHSLQSRNAIRRRFDVDAAFKDARGLASHADSRRYGR